MTADDRPDLVVASSGSNTVSVLLNALNGNFTGQAYTVNSSGPAATFSVTDSPTPSPQALLSASRSRP